MDDEIKFIHKFIFVGATLDVWIKSIGLTRKETIIRREVK